MPRTKTIVKFRPIKTIEIEVAISKYFGVRQHIIVPNISWGFTTHECDLFIIKKSGVAVEVEIKISKSDLLADFKKGHNHVDKQNRITEFYYAMPEDLYIKCKDLIPNGAGVLTCSRYLDYKKREQINVFTRQQPIRIKGARKLTIEEQFKIATLGTMRIIALKDKIIKLQNKLTENGIIGKVRKPRKTEEY
jgi:hypothetical protein